MGVAARTRYARRCADWAELLRRGALDDLPMGANIETVKAVAELTRLLSSVSEFLHAEQAAWDVLNATDDHEG